jgi:hypothetical protein
MKMKRSLAIFVTALMLTSFLGPALIANVVAGDPASWYKVKNGVLTSDYYSLYPYATQSVDMGISKYGEMIGETGSLAVGLQYPGYETVGTYDQTLGTSRDPFANEAVPRSLWLNGWVMEIRYTHRTLRDRRILVMAMYADMAVYGGDWITAFNYTDLSRSPHGGRKTTAYATTDPLTPLYDGPREYIALSVTHIYDWTDDNGDGKVQFPDETWPVLDLKMTFIFDKVSKQVIILKDIKLLMSGKELASPVDVQFSDREEWDLGPATEWPSYAHFYTQELSTYYGAPWSTATAILREYHYKGAGDITAVPVSDANYGPPIATGSVRVYINGVFKEEGLDYDINYATGAITWHIPQPLHTDLLEVIYKLRKYENREALTGVPYEYDLAQIISADKDVDGFLDPQYVGYKAYWPVLSDYTVDGWTTSLTPLINVSQADLAKEPEIPFTVGEWDFLLGKGYSDQFRGVEVVGVTDYHDASDAQMTPGAQNVIDREVMYQVNQVFNPWDLYDAVEKPTSRWVDFTKYIDVTVNPLYITTDRSAPVVVEPYYPWTLNFGSLSDYVKIGSIDWIPNPMDWDQYNTFAERIENLTDGTLLQRTLDYNITLRPDGRANVTFAYSGYYKILYSTMGGRYEWVTVGRDANSVDSVGSALVSAAIKDKEVEIGLGGLDLKSATYNLGIPYLLNKFGTGNAFTDYFKAPDNSQPGQRLAFMDDWCTYWPISSSNIITVGGPAINWIAMYFNDFTDALWAAPWFTTYAPWSGKIAGIACWNKTAYTNSGGETGVGYATIGTYLDINGTIGFTVYGLDGRDTYYATYWLNGDPARGILPGTHQLQDAPDGLTSIIIKIDYKDAKHPVFSIVECLGTISEREWIHNLETKGGIHVDP